MHSYYRQADLVYCCSEFNLMLYRRPWIYELLYILHRCHMIYRTYVSLASPGLFLAIVGTGWPGQRTVAEGAELWGVCACTCACFCACSIDSDLFLFFPCPLSIWVILTGLGKKNEWSEWAKEAEGTRKRRGGGRDVLWGNMGWGNLDYEWIKMKWLK